MHKIVFTVYILLLYTTQIVAQPTLDTTKKLLPEGTIIKVVIMNDINGKDVNVGQNIDFELQDDIIINNTTLVKKGAKIIGQVTEAAASKALGKKGKLAFSIDYLYLPDSRIIKLRSQVEKNLKGSGGAVAAGALIVSPLALVFNGKNAKYAKGEIFNAYIDKDYWF